MTELTDEQTAIIEKVQKLLRLANRNSNEAESAAATAKAQELLTAYNLDMAMVGEVSAGDAKREEASLKGGAYLYQRWLWQSVSDLNFCLYWSDQKYIHYKRKRKDWDGTVREVDWPRLQWHHFFVGRVVNVVATRVMATYLEQAIERLVRERLADKVTGIVPNTALFSNWAVSYRTGAANRIIEKIEERRNELMAEEHRKKAEAARAGVSTSNALTISSYKSAEEDANADFLYGEGWSAEQAAKRAERAAKRAKAEAEYAQWAADNPEEAAKAEAEVRREREKQERRRASRNASFNSKINHSAYYSGYDAANSISIDQQVNNSGQQRRIK